MKNENLTIGYRGVAAQVKTRDAVENIIPTKLNLEDLLVNDDKTCCNYLEPPARPHCLPGRYLPPQS